MARKIRKQVYIDDNQERRLKRLPDRQAWDAELKFIRSRAALPAGTGTRTWSREELYLHTLVSD
jgi:hypothetical protein